MAQSYTSIIQELRSVLQSECRLQSEYIKALADEEKAMHPFNSEKVDDLNAVRSDLCDRMADLQERRKALVLALTGGLEMRLTEAIEKHCMLRDKQQLFPLARRLKELIYAARKDTREFNDLTTFSLGLVNSLISIMSSGRHGVSRSYSGRGIIRESYHPGGATRLSSVLKQA